MPKRINPIALYLLCLAMTIIAYTFYARFAVPAIEGPPQLVKKRIVTPADKPKSRAERRSELTWLFPTDAWELKTSNALQTSHGKILFQDYETQPDGHLIVFPFTMIMDGSPGPDGKSTPPLVLRCLQEAKIKFDRPFTMSESSGSGSGQMEQAQLTGEVVIYRPPSAPNKNDSMQIVTRNVQIEKKSVFTLEEVRFQFGPNKGSGRNLLIELAHKDPINSAIATDFSKIDGVRRVELAFLYHLKLESSKKQPLDPNQADTTFNSFLSNNRSPIDITSKGPFVFDVVTNTATISKQVVVRQQDKFADELLCDNLILNFEGGDQNAINPMKGDNSSMRIRRITAIGTPAIINAHSRDTKLTGDEIVYDIVANRITGKSNTASVTVVNKQHQFDAQSFIYSIPADQSLGPLHANGPGRMLQFATKERGEFRANWKDKLVVRNDENGMKLIQMDGAANITVNQDTEIKADHLKFWLWQMRLVKTDPKTGQKKSDWDYQPAKVFTRGNVFIDSPKLEGNTSELTATWPKPVLAGSETRRAYHSHVGEQNYFSRRPTYQESGSPKLLNQTEMIAPTDRKAQIALASFEQPDERQRKFRVQGNKVNLDLSSHETGSEIKQLEITGNVNIVETRTAKPDDRPLKISGDRLQMTPQGPEAYRIEVAGSFQRQAVVDADGLKLTGVVIHMDQNANKLWVDGAGQMKLISTDKKPTQNSKRPSRIDVSWGGGMVFDGRTIYFEQNVIMNADQKPNPSKLRKTKSLSQGLSVRLTRHLNFKNLSAQDRTKDEQGVEIEEMVLVDQVPSSKRIFQQASSALTQTDVVQPIVVENHDFDANGMLLEKQKFLVPKVTINAISGDISAVGPGTIMNHRTGKSSFSFSPANKQTSRGQDKTGLSFLQINFDKSLVANSNNENMVISGNVRTLFTPVGNWNQTLDPDKTTQIPPGGVKLTCETVNVDKWQPRGAKEPTNEVIARGNAHIYGDLYEATADRVSYNEATDILVIEGTPRSDAQLSYRQNPRARADHLVAGKILYRISDQRTEVHKIKNGSFSPNGNLFNGSR